MSGKDGEGVVLYAKVQLKHVESCCGAGDRPVESLWVQIRGEANKRRHLEGIFYRSLGQEGQC